MTTITIVLEDELAQLVDNAVQQSSSSPEEIVKQAIYHYLNDLQKMDAGEDPLVGLFDLGDPLLSENVEEVLQAMFRKEENSSTP